MVSYSIQNDNMCFDTSKSQIKQIGFCMTVFDAKLRNNLIYWSNLTENYKIFMDLQLVEIPESINGMQGCFILDGKMTFYNH